MKNDIPGKCRQTIAAFIMSLPSLVIGISIAWTSRVTRNLQKADNELGMKPLSDDEMSWLVAVSTIGLLSTMLWGSKLCERLGRRKAAIVEAFIIISTWLLKLFATSFNVLLVGQLIQGVSDGLAALIIPVYITEIASDAIRGRLVCIFTFSVKSGYLLAFVLAATLPYKIMTGFTLVAPVIQLGGLFLLPDTPMYLIRNNRLADAQRSLMWLRGNDNTTVESELVKLQKFHRKIMQSKSTVGIKDLFTDRLNLNGLIIAMTMIAVQQMSGIIIMLLYIVTILDKAKTSMDPYIASIVYASVHLIGCCLSTLTVDRFGRKPLLLVSLSGMAICHCILGIFLTVQNSNFPLVGYDWLLIVTISLYGFTYSIGVGPLTPMISNEVVNPELASICNSILLISLSLASMALMKFFPILTNTIGLENCFFIFFTTCLIGFFIVLFAIPETKGKSIESIRQALETRDKIMHKTVAEESLVNSSKC